MVQLSVQDVTRESKVYLLRRPIIILYTIVLFHLFLFYMHLGLLM